MLCERFTALQKSSFTTVQKEGKLSSGVTLLEGARGQGMFGAPLIKNKKSKRATRASLAACGPGAR